MFTRALRACQQPAIGLVGFPCSYLDAVHPNGVGRPAIALIEVADHEIIRARLAIEGGHRRSGLIVVLDADHLAARSVCIGFNDVFRRQRHRLRFKPHAGLQRGAALAWGGEGDRCGVARPVRIGDLVAERFRARVALGRLVGERSIGVQRQRSAR